MIVFCIHHCIFLINFKEHKSLQLAALFTAKHQKLENLCNSFFLCQHKFVEYDLLIASNILSAYMQKKIQTSHNMNIKAIITHRYLIELCNAIPPHFFQQGCDAENSCKILDRPCVQWKVICISTGLCTWTQR